MKTVINHNQATEDTAVLPSGRKLYRHESGQGSVLEFDYWGSPMKIFVADAKYRGSDSAYDLTQRSHDKPQLPVAIDYFNGSADNDVASLTYTKDDAWIQSTYAVLKYDGTAKDNTDLLMKFSTTEAAHHCRKQDIPGVGQLDLPNLYELIILYLESDHIDALDPTVESNRDKALGMMNPNGRFCLGIGLVWSSTETSLGCAWYVCNDGANCYQDQSIDSSVVPVKELDA